MSRVLRKGSVPGRGQVRFTVARPVAILVSGAQGPSWKNLLAMRESQPRPRTEDAPVRTASEDTEPPEGKSSGRNAVNAGQVEGRADRIGNWDEERKSALC